jgi:hypothetical protein
MQEPALALEDQDEYFPARPSSRPLSRLSTSRSLKAFRVLGAEAAASRPDFKDEDDDVKRQLWDMWASQHKLGSLNEDEEDGNGEKRPATSAEARPRIRRKLTKKKKVEELKAVGEHGKFYNLMHYGSVSKPMFDRPTTSMGRSFSSRQ